LGALNAPPRLSTQANPVGLGEAKDLRLPDKERISIWIADYHNLFDSVLDQEQS
jgi:hypothetical protein